MRPLYATPLLFLALLGGCAQPQYILSEQTAATAVAGTQRISLHIGSGFSASEQDKIMAGVRDWNSAQKGNVRIDVAVLTGDATESGGWTIFRPSGRIYATSDEWRPEPLAVTQRAAGGGGSIVVFPDRLGSHDLRSIVANELGVAFGAT